MTASVPTNGNAARQLWLTIIGLMLTMMFAGGAAIFWVGGIAYSVGQNARDIQNLGNRLDKNDADTHELQIVTATLKSANVEIETQFRALDQLGNVRIAEDLRWRCMFLDRVYKQKCSDIAYFPAIARDPH